MNAGVLPYKPQTRRRSWLRGIYLIVGVLTFIVLARSFSHLDMVGTEPSVAEVAGRYHLSKVAFGKRVDAEILSKASDAYIELRLDGSAVFHKLPVVPENQNKNFEVQEFRSGPGTYTISALGGSAKRDFYGLYLSRDDLPDPICIPRFVCGRKSFGLVFEYFDGDFTRRMTFMRDESTAKPADGISR